MITELRLPPSEIIREEPTPDDLLLVVRGGRHSLSNANLERATADTWERYGFFGISVFGAPGDDLMALSSEVGAIRRRSEVRLARVGGLRAARYEVVPTFTNRAHFSVVLGEASVGAFALLRSCFSAPRPNPGYEPDR